MGGHPAHAQQTEHSLAPRAGLRQDSERPDLNALSFPPPPKDNALLGRFNWAVPKPKTPPPLVGALGLLGKDWQARLRVFARFARPACRGLQRRFRALTPARELEPEQRRALQAVTTGAAVEVLAGGGAISTFLEQVDYHGRRLAKLGLPPRAVLESLTRYNRLLEAELRRRDPEQARAWRPVRQQLDACVAITLNNAFYQVREAETRAFFELSHAGLESKTEAQLLVRSGEILRRYCRAQAGRIAFADGSIELPHGLGRPRCFALGAETGRWLLEPGWSRRYRWVWSVPLATGWPVGLMQFAFSQAYPWLPRELELLMTAGEYCRLACEKARLVAELEARERQLRALAEHMLQVEEAERRRIRRELHDEAGQLLMYLRLRLERLERLAPASPAELRPEIEAARRLVEQTIMEIRRLLADLSPAVLEQLGLAAALRQLAGRFRRAHPIQVRLRLVRLRRLPSRLETGVYRLVQECLNNVARHSGARRVMISLRTSDQWLELSVRDDGKGFDVAQAMAKAGSFGLAGMLERVALLGGACEVASRPGRGTIVTVRLPIPAPERSAINSPGPRGHPAAARGRQGHERG